MYVFAGELVCVRLAVWALPTVMLLCRFESKGAASRDGNKQINVECSCPVTSLISVYVLRTHRMCVCVCFLSHWICILSSRGAVSLSLSYCHWWNVCLGVRAHFLGGCEHLSLSSLCVCLYLSLWIQRVLCHWCPLYVFVSSSLIFLMTVMWKRNAQVAFRPDCVGVFHCLFGRGFTVAFVKTRMCMFLCVCAHVCAASLCSDSSSLQSEN